MMTNHMTRLGTWRWCHQSDYSPIFFFFGLLSSLLLLVAVVVVTAAVRRRRNGGLFCLYTSCASRIRKAGKNEREKCSSAAGVCNEGADKLINSSGTTRIPPAAVTAEN